MVKKIEKNIKNGLTITENGDIIRLKDTKNGKAGVRNEQNCRNERI